MNRTVGSSLLAATVAGMLLAPLPGDGDGSQATPMRVGFSGRLSTDVGREDVQVAVELWAREVAKKMALEVVPRISFIDSRDALLSAIESHELDMVVMSVLDYLDLDPAAEVDIEPAMVSESDGAWGFELVLIVRRAAHIQTLQQLENAKLVLQTKPGGSSLEHLWLQTRLLRDGVADARQFFREVREVEKTSPAILAVLFGQADVALVRQSAFKTMAELNPQLEADLEVIAISPGYLPTLMCFLDHTDASKRAAIYEGALELHTHHQGRQILTLFGNDRVIPFAQSYLSGVRELRSEHQRLVGSARNGGSS